MKTWEEVWDKMTGQQHNAFHMKVWAVLGGRDTGEENMRRLMAGRIQLRVEEVNISLFDRHSRRIPPQGLHFSVLDANRDFHLIQPTLDYDKLITRAAELLQQGPIMSAADFEARAKAILKQINADKQLSNLLKGVHLPIVLPQMAVLDYGKVLEDTFLAAVEKSYTAAFPGRPFHNCRKNDLAGKVTVASGTRHDQLIARMSQGTVVGIYFPTALQGYSVPACREQMTSLSDQIILSGGLDIAMAMAMYPDVLARDFNTPGLDMAALQWSSADYSLCFKASDGDLDFSRRNLYASGNYSAGLLLLEPACR